MAYDARAIANEFIKRARRDGMALTNMQLQKLPYIAHGWSLALFGRPLIANESAQAWKYGPVYPSLYDSLSLYGSGAVTDFIHENDRVIGAQERGKPVTADLSWRQNAFLDTVWEKYRGLTAWQLSDLTHKNGTPWSRARNRGDRSALLDDEIEEHYLSLLPGHPNRS